MSTRIEFSHGEAFIRQVAGHVWRLDVETGESSGICPDVFGGESAGRIDQIVCSSARLLVCSSDQIYVVCESERVKFVRGYERCSGKLRFEQNADRLSLLFIYYDMLAGMLDDVELKLWDRYTGEELLHTNGVPRATNLAGCHGFLVTNNNERQLVCFKASEPYISGHAEPS